MSRADSVPLLRVLHPDPCDACGSPMLYGAEILGDRAIDEPELHGLALHVVCYSLASHGLRASRALAAFLAWAGA